MENLYKVSELVRNVTGLRNTDVYMHIPNNYVLSTCL